MYKFTDFKKCVTLSPTIMEVENYPNFKQTNLGDEPIFHFHVEGEEQDFTLGRLSICQFGSVQVAAAVPQSVATAILEHREALLRACRSLDIEGSGQLPAQEKGEVASFRRILC